MTDTYYMISEASKLVHVESHVLRYWEEELGLDIPRNELGHRIYSQDHIRLFRVVKILKKKGYQLRAVKELLPHLQELSEEEVSHFQSINFEMVVEEKSEERSGGGEFQRVTREQEDEKLPSLGSPEHQEHMEQFEKLMSDIIVRALERYELQRVERDAEAPVELSERSLGQLVERIEALLDRREEREEERCRLLDECIRTYQRMNQEQARRGFWIFKRKTG